MEQRKILLAVAQALTLGREVAEVYAEAVTLLRRLEDSPINPAALIGLDAAGLYQLSKVRACSREPCVCNHLTSFSSMTVP